MDNVTLARVLTVHLSDAQEIIDLARSGPLLSPSHEHHSHPRVTYWTDDFEEANRIYSLIFDDPEKATQLGLKYLPDRIAHEQGTLFEYGETRYLDAVVPLKEQVSNAVFARFGSVHPDIANDLEGMLCAILEARLARGRTVFFMEALLDILTNGWLPLGVFGKAPQETFAVYSGGL